MTGKNRFVKSFLNCGLAFLYLPLAVLVINAFMRDAEWSSFSLKWFKQLWSNKLFIGAALTSLKIGFIAATISVIVGVLAAVYVTESKQPRRQNLVRGICTSPMLLPEVILGLTFLLGYLALQDGLGLPEKRGEFTIIVSHSIMGISYAFITVKNRLKRLDPLLLEAAQDLGVTPLKSFFLVTLPVIMPTLVSAWLLAFVVSFDDVVVASFVSGAEVTTLPMAIFSSIKFGMTAEVNALATLIVFIVSAVIFIGAYYTQKSRAY
tara:strand:+ start:612 stop:1403 length:792 start_codon:yes stop_codon:yes gene_type:complete